MVVYFHPGDAPRVLGVGAVMVTVVGSCVAACLWDPSRRLGSMTHALLPRYEGVGTAGRFADSATRLAISRLLAQGCSAGALEARLFGGATMHLPEPDRASADGSEAPASIGARNVMVTTAVLREHGVAIVSTQVGGFNGRRLSFEISSGEIAVKAIPRLDA